MNRRTNGRILVAAALACTALFPHNGISQTSPGVDPPRPSEQIVPIIAKDSKVELIELQTRILELSNKIISVDGHDPDILTIIPVSSRRLRLKAEKSGVTSFTLTDEFNNVYTVEVFVDADVRELQAYLGRLFPSASIKVIGLHDSVLLRGWVAEPQLINEITDVAEQFSANVMNQMSVAGVSQIQLQVKVLEVQRSKLRQLGFNFLHVGQNGYFASTPGALAPISSATLPIGGAPTVAVSPTALANPTAQFAVTGASGVFQSFIEAIETNSLAKVLADTALVTNSGRPATLLAGGQFPVLVPQQLGTVTIQYREFGVRMEAVPIVLGNGRLRLDVAPEVSERDVSSAVVVNGFVVPGITLRRVNTQVEMRFGETLMLGGLILQRETETRTKVPYLGDLPWIGSAFSRRRSEVGETELLIMVTPQMAAPIGAGQLPFGGPGTNTEPASDKEFYFDGHIEVPVYNPSFEPIGGSFDPGLMPANGPLMPPLEPPPGFQSGPTAAPPPEASADQENVTQTSGVRAGRRHGRGMTLGMMRPFRTDRTRDGHENNPSLRPNAGDDVRDGSIDGYAPTAAADSQSAWHVPLSAEPPPGT